MCDRNIDCEALGSQSSVMGANDDVYQRPANGRRPTYAEQPSFPDVFGQRPAFQSRTPTMVNGLHYLYVHFDRWTIYFRPKRRMCTTRTEALKRRVGELKSQKTRKFNSVRVKTHGFRRAWKQKLQAIRRAIKMHRLMYVINLIENFYNNNARWTAVHIEYFIFIVH